MENPPKKFFRLSPGTEVRLRYAYFITCREAVDVGLGEQRDDVEAVSRQLDHAEAERHPGLDWLLEHAFQLVPAQAYVGQFLTSFREFPQRQKAASFNMDEVMQKLKESSK